MFAPRPLYPSLLPIHPTPPNDAVSGGGLATVLETGCHYSWQAQAAAGARAEPAEGDGELRGCLQQA